MPTNKSAAKVRPAWVDVTVSDRQTNIGTGPRARDGYLQAEFYVREYGEITHLGTVSIIGSKDKATVMVELSFPLLDINEVMKITQ